MSEEAIVRVFVSDESGPDQYAGFFEDTSGGDGTPPGGFLYIEDRQTGTITKHLKVTENHVELKESDVAVFWSSDGVKCGVSIWGRMRGIIALGNGTIAEVVSKRNSAAISDAVWLAGFDSFLDWSVFISVRRQYWKEIVKKYEGGLEVGVTGEAPPETNFILYAKSPHARFAVFEDDGTTGYLYVIDSEKSRITHHVHMYDRTPSLPIGPEDVSVLWETLGEKCGVVVWGKMRAIIDLNKERPGRVWLDNPDSPGIEDEEWLDGFSETVA